ncbi:MerR family transcriptional regulator [Levilactobacillus brevis]|uniref:MerR family transcriptional regulator n=1 Tax=Levilactobacillus brevis TaxID=1580 RepID=UPI0021A52DEA|nr:MerR family transcriptional regulator [Levilactobacillus brevis]MCT3573550.1 MerR family transcriptional regulator [Levilactobacillus brevis]
MSTYTTGELAKHVGVSVRTIQYYDQRGLLTPMTTAGGRREYTAQDIERLQLILVLKSMGLKLAVIKDILNSPNATDVLQLLLTEQVQRLRQDQAATTTQLKTVIAVQKALAVSGPFPLESIHDMDQLMTNQQRLRQVHGKLIIGGLVMDAIEVAGWLTYHYFQAVRYRCPNCHTVFQPRFKQAFWAGHHLRTRKLTCPACGKTTYCVEVAASREQA